MEVGKAGKKVGNGGGMGLLLFEHTREGMEGNDSINGVLIFFHFTKFSFDPIVFLSVGNGIIIFFIQDFITHGDCCL